VASPQHQNLLASSEALGDKSNRPYIEEHDNGTRVDGHEADRNGKRPGNVWQHLSQYLDTVAFIERAKLKRDKHTFGDKDGARVPQQTATDTSRTAEDKWRKTGQESPRVVARNRQKLMAGGTARMYRADGSQGVGLDTEVE
jgi:hypothetical protein